MIPIIIATSKSSRLTVTAVLVSLVELGKYDEYVIRMPMPRLSEKNACPRALRTTEGVILLKSGFRKYASPSAALSSYIDTPHITKSTRNSTGIRTLLRRSIPF